MFYKYLNQFVLSLLWRDCCPEMFTSSIVVPYKGFISTVVSET